MKFASFMASPAGRAARVILGVIIITIGLAVIGGTAGWIVALIGLVPIAAGAADVCLVAPLLGVPFRGSEIRRQAARPRR